MKSARSLSKTIDSLISKEKDRVSDYYESHLRERSLKNSIQSREFNLRRVDFSSTLQHDSGTVDCPQNAKNFASLDLKDNKIFGNESQYSYQSRGCDDAPDFYPNELNEFSRNDSQQSTGNPLQKSQLQPRLAHSGHDIHNTPSFQAGQNSTLRLQSLRNFSLGASQ